MRIVDDCPPFFCSNQSQLWLELYSKIVSRIEGRRVGFEPGGGASDVNYAFSKTAVHLDGLGPIGSGMHTEHEYVDVLSLSQRAQSLAEFLIYIEENTPCY